MSAVPIGKCAECECFHQRHGLREFRDAQPRGLRGRRTPLERQCRREVQSMDLRRRLGGCSEPYQNRIGGFPLVAVERVFRLVAGWSRTVGGIQPRRYPHSGDRRRRRMGRSSLRRLFSHAPSEHQPRLRHRSLGRIQAIHGVQVSHLWKGAGAGEQGVRDAERPYGVTDVHLLIR